MDKTAMGKSKITAFICALITDGYRLVGGIAPLLSIGFTLLKAFGPANLDLHGISYAWALAPLVGWLFVAYLRQWLHSGAKLQRLQDEVTALRVSMDNRAALNAARHRLSLLRSAGVKIRNDGMRITMEDFADWCTQAEQWNTDVKRALAKSDPAIAEWYAILDAVPPPRISLEQPLNFQHQKLYGEHDFRLVRLDHLISDNRLADHA